MRSRHALVLLVPVISVSCTSLLGDGSYHIITDDGGSLDMDGTVGPEAAPGDVTQGGGDDRAAASVSSTASSRGGRGSVSSSSTTVVVTTAISSSAGTTSTTPSTTSSASATTSTVSLTDAGCVVLPINTLYSFNTTGAVCIESTGAVTGGWQASNVSGRTVTIIGATTQTGVSATGNIGAIAPDGNGIVTWEFTAGTYTYASMSWY